MNKDLIENLDKYYGYAKKIAGSDYMDLMHHCLELIPDDVKHIDAYTFITLRNEYINPKSKYNKLYNPKAYEENIITDSTATYDTNLLYKILLELEDEGLIWEVTIFKRCYLFSSFKDTHKRTGLSYYKLRQICNYIQTEIKHRYVKLDKH